MESEFNSRFFAGNRQRLRELFTGTAPIVIAANGLMQRGGDSAFGFAQDANFWYLTGLDEPDLVLVMDRDKEYVIVPARSVSRQAFDGAVNHHNLSRKAGIATIYDDKAGWEQLSGRLKKVKHVATVAPAPAYVEPIGLYTNPARAVLIQRLKSAKDDLELLDVGPHLARLRMVKQAPELAAIQQAINVTIGSLRETLRPNRLARYRYEYELEAELARGFRRRGSRGYAFDPIVAAGPRGVTLHNVTNDGAIDKGQLVVVDVGAEVDHYAADITRTVGVGNLSRRQRAVHAAVIDVQLYAVNLLQPGIQLKDYEQQIELYMGEKLRELGLIKSISHTSVRKFFPHATSHFLGLNVHDSGDYDRPLEPGVVVTVEPGIYIPKEGIGVRIEDDILITRRGHKVLSAKLPSDLR